MEDLIGLVLIVVLCYVGYRVIVSHIEQQHTIRKHEETTSKRNEKHKSEK